MILLYHEFFRYSVFNERALESFLLVFHLAVDEREVSEFVFVRRAYIEEVL